MAKEIMYPPLVGWKSLLKGILGASLIVGGLVNPYGMIIQVVLFLAGLFVLLDGIMVSGKGVFIVICLIAAIFGGVFTLVLSVAGLGIPYLAVIFITTILLYLRPFLKSGGMAIRRKGETQENQEKPG